MTNLEKIREACVKANPEIIELKFGCEVDYYGERTMAVSNEADYEQGKYIFVSPEVKGNNMVFLDDKNIKIIGRPIRLADVLLVLKECINISFSAEYSEFFEGDINTRTGIFWNLRDDNLEYQSKETITFIAGLL